MIEWDENSEEVRKIRKDLEMAKSLLKMVEKREKILKLISPVEFTSILIENYYEIIKEIITALMAIDGYKTLSHEILVGYLKHFYKEFSDYEINFIDELRKLRNNINYRGFFVDEDYLKRNKTIIVNITLKLKNILKGKLNVE